MPADNPELPSLNLEEILDTIDADIREAIAIVEFVERPLFDGEFLKQFENTYSSHGLELIRSVLHKAGVVLVGRLWDPKDSSHSIPALYRLITEETYIQGVILRRRSAQQQIIQDLKGPLAEKDAAVIAAAEKLAARDSDRAERIVLQQYNQLKLLFTDQKEIERRESLRNLRHKIAHPIKTTDIERNARKAGRTIQNVKWHDLRYAVEHSAKLAVLLASLSQDMNSNCDDRSPWVRYAYHFWNSISAPK